MISFPLGLAPMAYISYSDIENDKRSTERMHLFTNLSIHSLTHSLTPSLTHSVSHSLSQSVTHSEHNCLNLNRQRLAHYLFTGLLFWKVIHTLTWMIQCDIKTYFLNKQLQQSTCRKLISIKSGNNVFTKHSNHFSTPSVKKYVITFGWNSVT